MSLYSTECNLSVSADARHLYEMLEGACLPDIKHSNPIQLEIGCRIQLIQWFSTVEFISAQLVEPWQLIS